MARRGSRRPVSHPRAADHSRATDHSGAADRPRAAELRPPTSVYRDAGGDELELRGSLTPGARVEYATTLAAGGDREDAWQRAVELLFERLAVSWTIAGLRIDRQRELLGRYRMASGEERRFVRESLREHLAEHFPELRAP